MYKKRRNGGSEMMRKGYTPPPGYDGSRFVRNHDNDSVTAIGDEDYTLSIGGIPQSKFYDTRTENPQRTQTQHDRECEECKDCKEPEKSYASDRDSAFESGGRERREERTLPQTKVRVKSSKRSLSTGKSAERKKSGKYAYSEKKNSVIGEKGSSGSAQTKEKECLSVKHKEECEGSKERFGQDDLLLILLIILLAGEKNSSDLVLILAILLGIR